MVQFTNTDREMMARAIRLARKGLDDTTPNPRVGCVIVDEQSCIIGEGFHARAGEPHAEINALASIAEVTPLTSIDQDTSAKNATVYVTLEPCSHHGRTGPCADALIRAGVKRVVFGMEDPNPRVAGDGLEKLRRAGVDVHGPLLEDDCRQLNLGFIKRMQNSLPYVRCKMAMSLDGRTAMANGKSRWITGPAARADVQKLRARSCAIVTGVETVIHDNPALTVRIGENKRQPLRVIVDTHDRCPANLDIFSQPGKTIIARVSVDREKYEMRQQMGVDYWELPEKDGKVDLRALFRKCADEGCNEVLVETGAVLAGACLSTGVVDEIVIYMAAKLLGSEARPLFDLPIQTMSAQLPVSVQDITAVGSDWRIVARPDPEG